MQSLVTATLRTVVPAIVGQFVTWLFALGVILDTETVAGLEAALIGLIGALVTGLYYWLVRKAAQEFPALETLIGSRKAPTAYKIKK